MSQVVVITEQELVKRSAEISRMLSVLTKNRHGPATKPYMASQYLIAAHDGSPPGNFRDCRFHTKFPKVLCHYQEAWSPVKGKSKSYYLQRAYLNFHKLTGPNKETEYFALHCDPNEHPMAPHAHYKKGPHLHLSAAVEPFSNAHIALTLTHLNQVLSDKRTLENAFKVTLQMLVDELLAPPSL